MQKFKRMGRCVTGLLLALVLSLPVSALAIQTPISNALIPSVPVVPMEIPKSDNQGHLVSLVRRSQYSGATVVGCLEDGTRISVLKTAGDFYRIDCYDMTGYIAKSQVQVNENGEYVVKCDPESKESKYLPSYSSQEALNLKSMLRDVSDDYLGVRYLYAGTTPKGFDCSGYTQYVFAKNGLSIHRTVINQMGDGIVIRREDLQCGDLIIFSNTTSRGFASHVGMYIGDGKMIHSGNGGVAISRLDTPYWNKYYQGSRRIILTGLENSVASPAMGLLQNNTTAFWRKNSQLSDGITNG